MRALRYGAIGALHRRRRVAVHLVRRGLGDLFGGLAAMEIPDGLQDQVRQRPLSKAAARSALMTTGADLLKTGNELARFHAGTVTSTQEATIGVETQRVSDVLHDVGESGDPLDDELAERVEHAVLQSYALTTGEMKDVRKKEEENPFGLPALPSLWDGLLAFLKTPTGMAVGGVSAYMLLRKHGQAA